MSAPSATPSPEAFEFLLLRRRLVDDEGRPVTDDPNDLEQSALAEALTDANTPPSLVPVGHGHMTIIAHGDDVRAFVRDKLAHEPEDDANYCEAAEITMEPGAERGPAIGDLLAVLLHGNVALLFEVMFSWIDCEESAAHVWPEHADLEWKPCFTLAPGHAILRRGPELPLVSTGGDDEEPEILGGSDAEH